MTGLEIMTMVLGVALIAALGVFVWKITAPLRYPECNSPRPSFPRKRESRPRHPLDAGSKPART